MKNLFRMFFLCGGIAVVAAGWGGEQQSVSQSATIAAQQRDDSVVLRQEILHSEQPEKMIAKELGVSTQQESQAGGALTLEGERSISEIPASLAPQLVTFPSYVVDQNGKLASLEHKIEKLTDSVKLVGVGVVALKQSLWERLLPALFGFLGVVIGGGVNYVLHGRQLKHSENERREKFSFEVRQGVFEYRSRQNNEFYGPLLVLLAQSKQLSTQLHDQLAARDSKRYIFVDEGEADTLKKTLHVADNSAKRAFRLIEEMPHIGAKLHFLLPQVKVIIEVGERMAALIEKSSGLADPKNSKLHEYLGLYLAHLAALKDAYEQVKRPGGGRPARLHTAAFPRYLQDLVRQDYDLINKYIQSWEEGSETNKKGGI